MLSTQEYTTWEIGLPDYPEEDIYIFSSKHVDFGDSNVFFKLLIWEKMF